MARRTVIVGGGLAGLAAAAALAQRGVAVTILESRPRLGGRASSFVDKATGTQIDNCQHVSLGCCTNFQHFCRMTGLDGLFRIEPELYFIGPDNRVNRMSAGPLPAPLHFLFSFLRLSYLSTGDRARIALGMRALTRSKKEDARSIVFSDWLRRHRQTPTSIERFWAPVLVSALSETLDRIDIDSARKVFVDAFLANREGWSVQIPTVPLSVLYGERLTNWLATRGATVKMQSGVDRVTIENGRATGVVLRSGEVVAADHVIAAVPHWLVLDLLPAEYRDHPDLSGIWQLESAPISSVHLWFDRPILGQDPAARARRAAGSAGSGELPHAVLIGRFSQWIFNRSRLQIPEAAEPVLAKEAEPARAPVDGYSYQVVISASRDVVSGTQRDVVARVVEELEDVFPGSRGAVLLHSRLVTEHRAVFSVRPGAERCRPAQQSPVANLQLAGDWTRTGWPATMEGAVRSGYLAAQNVLRHLGRSETVVQPDLPASRLSRLLLRLPG